jgi:hypothetical protein
MKTSSIAVSDGCNAPMPESVRKAFELAVRTAWISAQKLTHEKAEAASHARFTAFEKQVEAITAVCTAQAAQLLDLRSKSASDEAEAAAVLSAARGETAEAKQKLVIMTQESAQSVSRTQNIANQVENLKITLRSAQIAAEALSAEIDTRPPGQCAQDDRVENHATEGQRPIDSVSAPARARIDRQRRLRRDEADLIAAAVFLIKTACQYRIGESEAAELDEATSNAQGRVLPL